MTPEDQALCATQIQSDEGLRLLAYYDSLGYVTFGYGHLIDPRKGGKVSQAAADFIFNEDFTGALDEIQVYAWYQVQDSVRQCALVNMWFNTDLLHFPLFLHYMSIKDYVNAVAQLVNTPWHSEVGSRAVRIENMIATGEWS